MPKGTTKGQKFTQTNPGALAAYHAEWLGKITPEPPGSGTDNQQEWYYGTGYDMQQNPGSIRNPIVWPRPKVGKTHGG